MITISLCMIVRDEEKTLARGLDTIKHIVDEINIIDTGSIDKTKEVASRYTDRIFDFKWIDNFSAARNFAFSKATKDYIFWMDADDVILEDSQQLFLQLKETLDPTVDSVSMKYNVGFDEYGNVLLSYRRNRLVKRMKYFKWIGIVHEYLAVNGNIFNSDICVTHKQIEHETHRNLNIYESQLAKGVELAPRDTVYYANELRDHRKWEKAITWYRKFLDDKKGWVEDNIQACNNLALCYEALGDKENEFHACLESFKYDTPRAEACCRMGYYFLNKEMYDQSIFWYEMATKIPMQESEWGFQNQAAWTWLPHLQLCVCYYRKGMYDKSYIHNEIARQYRPNDQSIKHNRKLLEDLGY
ncbi:glycosyltransferase [Longirhabdus pacifica]|uniref:glycosyltransferase n=1 Tax=Longirhabdus pacifica TaxID=2305227 RepID=UPI00100900AE|nr:glycosyltransferase family 2 protein [Longirhabdus pacifica]